MKTRIVKEIKWSIIVGFVFASFSIFIGQFDEEKAIWGWEKQLPLLWLISSAFVFTIDNLTIILLGKNP